MIEIRRADELGERGRRAVGEMFAAGFGRELSFLVKGASTFRGWDSTPELTVEQRRLLAAAVEHMLAPDVFYVALVDGEPAGITACTEGREPVVRFRWRELVRHLGPFRGTAAALVFRTQFQKPPRNPPPGPGRAFLAFVATAPEFRGQGVATAILERLHALPAYTEYVLEDIADTNQAALRLYERFGYQEFRRHRVRHGGGAGIAYYVSMRLTQA